MSKKILIVDDEATARYGARRVLQKNGYLVTEASNGLKALEQVEKYLPDIVLCDIKMPEMDGLEFLNALKQLKLKTVDIPLVVMITAYGSERIAVEAIKSGAYDYLSKPYDIDELRVTIQNALDKKQLQRENYELRKRLNSERAELVGESDEIKKVYEMINKVSETDVTVLLTGESGTGKELAARIIHNNSARNKGPFVTMNCAAIPKNLIESELFGHEKGAFTGATGRQKGKFEIADKGTLFLDEIADMSLKAQAKILRVLEDKSFTRLGGNEEIKTDVRLVSATNKNLLNEIENQKFRKDLYYRIKVIEIRMPSLAERHGDILILAEHFKQMFGKKYNKLNLKFDKDVKHRLMSFRWPGNVRQLQNVIEQCVVLVDSDVITTDHLPVEMSTGPVNTSLNIKPGQMSFTEAKSQFVEMFERDWIETALKESKGNVSKAARLLKIKRQFLQQKINRLGITAVRFRMRNSKEDPSL